MQELVEQRLRAAGRAVLLDVHSYPSRALPYELHADGPRPAVCLGVDPVHTPPWLLAAARRAFAPLGPVGVDSPFRGTYVPLAQHGRDRRVSSIMVELRRDTYLVEPDGPPTAGLAAAAAALARLVDAAGRSTGVISARIGGQARPGHLRSKPWSARRSPAAGTWTSAAPTPPCAGSRT